jgi:hypothetical protein
VPLSSCFLPGFRWIAARRRLQFRRIIGYRDLAKLAIAIERDLIARRPSNAACTPTTEAARRSV